MATPLTRRLATLMSIDEPPSGDRVVFWLLEMVALALVFVGVEQRLADGEILSGIGWLIFATFTGIVGIYWPVIKRRIARLRWDLISTCLLVVVASIVMFMLAIHETDYGRSRMSLLSRFVDNGSAVRDAAINKAVTDFIYELRQAAGKDYPEECHAYAPLALFPEHIEAIEALEPRNYESEVIVRQLSPLKNAVFGIYVTMIAFDDGHVPAGYGDLYNEYRSLEGRAWLHSAEYREEPGKTIVRGGRALTCVYGVRSVDEDEVKELLAMLKQAQHDTAPSWFQRWFTRLLL